MLCHALLFVLCDAVLCYSISCMLYLGTATRSRNSLVGLWTCCLPLRRPWTTSRARPTATPLRRFYLMTVSPRLQHCSAAAKSRHRCCYWHLREHPAYIVARIGTLSCNTGRCAPGASGSPPGGGKERHGLESPAHPAAGNQAGPFRRLPAGAVAPHV